MSHTFDQPPWFQQACANPDSPRRDFYLNRLTYLAFAREQAEPITRALRMLPTKPPSAQWAVFMRNHDELALERLSDNERAEVCKAFGFTDEMWLYDRGVPRRLPPILGGEPRRVRQAYSMAPEPARHPGGLVYGGVRQPLAAHQWGALASMRHRATESTEPNIRTWLSVLSAPLW